MKSKKVQGQNSFFSWLSGVFDTLDLKFAHAIQTSLNWLRPHDLMKTCLTEYY